MNVIKLKPTIPVTSLMRKAPTIAPSNCAIQYKMPASMVICPPRANPKVTAGLTCPPEMLAAIDTATKRANPWQIATATRPEGSRAESDVNLSAVKPIMINWVFVSKSKVVDRDR